ncbi:MAG: hypothetical protein JNN25_00775 [Candidatus Kapabacteria bacterium]|nr:hypothetical protein [Candidatus Kapabacteria bacterium]
MRSNAFTFNVFRERSTTFCTASSVQGKNSISTPKRSCRRRTFASATNVSGVVQSTTTESSCGCVSSSTGVEGAEASANTMLGV